MKAVSLLNTRQLWAGNGSRSDLADRYARGILFDYSYRYFYEDGYGKEFRILNLREDMDAEQRQTYLTGCLLAFLQQLRIFYDSNGSCCPMQLNVRCGCSLVRG